MRRFAIPVLVLAVFMGCKKGSVKNVSADDSQMNAAIANARGSVNSFIAALQAPNPNRMDFGIKMAFTQGQHTEHMWLDDVTYDGKRFHGILKNQPEKVRNVRYGQRVFVAPSQISDWMYVENGKLVGGYTIRVLRDAMSPRERAEFDKSVSFRFD